MRLVLNKFINEPIDIQLAILFLVIKTHYNNPKNLLFFDDDSILSHGLIFKN